MNTFATAIDNQEARTANNMKARVSTANSCVDLFFKIGASRGQDIIPAFVAALTENIDYALRIAQWARDVRGGAGERQLFKDILSYLEKRDPDTAIKLIYKIPEIGRWDDMLIEYTNSTVRDAAFALYGDAIKEGNGLAAKWAPRKGAIAVQLRRAWGMSPKQYRKTIVNLTNVVESLMCDKHWNVIDFGKIPSLAHARYRKAFSRNSETYSEYCEALEKGEAKINASAVYPYDVLKTVIDRYSQVNTDEGRAIIAQWDALPNYMSDENVLPMVDVSGSMTWGNVGTPGLMPIHVAVSLGLYCADKAQGAFKDVFLTFSGNPQLVKLKGNVLEKVSQMERADWGMNTNLHAAFDKVLTVATQHRVPASDMPSIILILSDMQFDACYSYDDSAIEMIRRKYSAAGYEMPGVVFWNLNSYGNVPVKFDEHGTALISGFSPSIMKSVLAGRENMTPEGIMRKAIMSERYDL